MNYNYDTSYTSYGAGGGSGGGGSGGGGFMPSEGSQQSPGGRRDFTQDSLRPVTIKQLQEAQPDPPSDSFKIDGTVISQVTFVAQIRNVSTQTTNVTYKFDDGTGSIEVKQWVDGDANPADDPVKAKLVEGAYCRAFGKIKAFNDRRFINCTIIRPIEDMNEVQYHLLEATAVHLYFTRGPPGGGNTGVSTGTGQGGAVAQGSNFVGSHDLTGYSEMSKRIFKYLKNAPQSNEGLHVHEIAAHMNVESADVATAGDALLSGGLIYTTVDEQTWAVLEMD